MCRAHAVAYEESVREASSPFSSVGNFGEGISSALDDLLTRGRIRKKNLEHATREVFSMLGAMGQRHAPNSGPVRPPPGWTPRRPAPPVDPKELERKRARKTLGFGSEPLTADMIKERRRKLAVENHPDKGGSQQRMSDINHAADVLLEAVA